MRGYRVYNNGLTVGDKIISALSYLTAGMIGFIWIMISQVSKKSLKPFVKYHAYQSIFISIIYYIFSILIGIILAFLKIIPFVGGFALAIVFYLAQWPVFFGFSILHSAMLLILFYLIYSALIGKYAELPWVSDNVKNLV